MNQALTEAGYEAVTARTATEAERSFSQRPPDLVLLDIMLPDGNGFDFLKRIRRDSQVPVMFLTARSGIEDRVRGLDGGADDYLVKPFRLEELLARVRAHLRRRESREAVTVGNVCVDLPNRRVTQEGRVIFLSTTEFAILELLARQCGEIVSKAAILKHVWDDEKRNTNVVEVYVNYLRHKLERLGSPRLIHTVRGQGYVLSEEPRD